MLLLRQDGTVWGWGYNSKGQVDPNDDSNFISQPRQIQGIKDVVDISAGNGSSAFLTKHGEVYVMGDNKTGWVNGVKEKLAKPTKIVNLEHIIRIDNRGIVLIALNAKGELYSTGGDRYALGRQVEPPTSKDQVRFYPAERVGLPRKVVDFATDDASVLALLDNGDVWVWGRNSMSSLGMGHRDMVEMPTKHPYLHQIVNIGGTAAVDAHGNLFTWGVYGYGNPLAPSTLRRDEPVAIAKDIKPSMLIEGRFTNGVLTQKGELWTWGWDESGQLGTGKLLTEHASKKDILTLNKSLFTTH